ADLARLREGPVFDTLRIDGELSRAVTLLNNPGAANEIVVQVAETLNKRRGMTSEVLSLVAIKKTLLIAAAMVAVAVAITRGMRPLRRLAADLARRSPRDLTPLSSADAPREVRVLIENTNGLLGRIEHMLGAHEAFIGNIAHQVRTPLAGIKLQAQLALRETDPASVRRALEQIARAADHMTHVNSQLLKLARAEIAFDRGPQAAPTDLVALVEACRAEFTAAARARDITLVAELPDGPIDIEGDPALLYEMLRNLVENAIVYGSRHGHVWVRVESDPQGPRLVVEDDGRGIPPEHRPPIFDHFYRPPNSPGEGCGLGLPIVREIARAHGGDVHLEDRAAGTGTRFVVALPPFARRDRTPGGTPRAAA
ncbi:MAG: ATP-binding protein, partial [Gammaproteobacteria bacterium]